MTKKAQDGGSGSRLCSTDFATEYDVIDDWKPPTTWEIFRRRGIKAVLQMKLERICVRVICDMHRDAREHGHNLVRPGYKTPWWFRIVNKLEFWCRPHNDTLMRRLRPPGQSLRKYR